MGFASMQTTHSPPVKILKDTSTSDTFLHIGQTFDTLALEQHVSTPRFPHVRQWWAAVVCVHLEVHEATVH